MSLRGLRVQLILWTILPLTLLLIGVAFTGVYSHEQSMRALVADRDRALATVGAAQVRDLLRQRAFTLGTLADAEAFHHQDLALKRAALTEAAEVRRQFGGEVVLLSETGFFLAAAAAVPVWADDGPLTASLAEVVMVRQGVVAMSRFDTVLERDVVLLGVPVRNAAGRTSGVLAGSVSLDNLALEDVLSRVQVGGRGVVYLVDAEGRILARSQSPYARESLIGHTGLDVALKGESSGATLCHAPDGERMTLAYAPVGFPDLDWRVLIEQPWREVIGPVLRYSQFMPVVAVMAVVVSLLTLYHGVRSIVQPLQALGRQSERVAWGDFAATGTSVGGVEEIEDLRRTLDHMARRIQNYQTGMHDYIAAITQGQEEERHRLARELHDDTVQALIALGQRVEMAQKALPANPERAAERLGEVRAVLAETLEGVRRFSSNLRPVYLEDLGFLPALEMLVREADRQEALAIHFATAGQARRLPPDLELSAFRIVQEALNNVVQHAQASHAWVNVHFEPGQLSLSVRDDGQGFEAPDLPDTLARQGHFGLMGIQERALLYGGQCAIRSAPGEGTEITVHLPYPPPG